MKKNISASIDEEVDKALALFCVRRIDNREYRLSKSEVVNTALKEHILKNGGVIE